MFLWLQRLEEWSYTFHISHIKFLFSMKLPVLLKAAGSAEGRHTKLTFIWFLSSVNSPMNSKYWGFAKGLPTHTRGFFPKWVILCTVSTEDDLKAFPHSWHTYGFSPVWLLICSVRADCVRPFRKPYTYEVSLQCEFSYIREDVRMC